MKPGWNTAWSGSVITTATGKPPMLSPRAEFFRRRRTVPWLLSAPLLAFVPKCLACLWAYAGLGAALGFGGRELCGTSASALDSCLSSFALAVIALIARGIFIVRRRH